MVNLEELAKITCLQQEVCMLQSQAQMDENWSAVAEIRFIYDEIATQIRGLMLNSPDQLFWPEVERRLSGVLSNPSQVKRIMDSVRHNGEVFIEEAMSRKQSL